LTCSCRQMLGQLAYWCVATIPQKIMMDKQHLNICTYNCRSAKNSFSKLSELCNICDILLLQEHWLLPFELNLLNNINPDFCSHGSSTVDTSSGILVGRPYGGTACLYRKDLAAGIKPVPSTNSRISALTLSTSCGPLLLINVYMLTNYGDNDSLELYLECLTYLHAIIVDSNAVHTVVAGDFNCSVGSRFFTEFKEFVADNNFVASDLIRLDNVTTYVSDDGQKLSWVDHIISSPTADIMLLYVNLLENFAMSDHRPLIFSLQCSITLPTAPMNGLNPSKM